MSSWIGEYLQYGDAHFDTERGARAAREELANPSAFVLETNGAQYRIRHERDDEDPEWRPVDADEGGTA